MNSKIVYTNDITLFFDRSEIHWLIRISHTKICLDGKKTFSQEASFSVSLHLTLYSC